MRSEQSSRWAILGLIALATWLLWKIVEPFATGFFLAAVLAGALFPIHRRLSHLLKDRPQASAAILTIAIVLLLVLPTTGIAAFVVREASDGVQFVLDTIRSEGAVALLDHLPPLLQDAVRRILRLFPDVAERAAHLLQRRVSESGGQAATAVGGMVAATGSMLFQIVMMLIAFFFLLTDGRKLAAWLEDVSPLRHGQTHELLMRFRKVSVSVMTSTIATAGVQTCAALIGYLIAGVPHPFFFAVATFIIAFIPAVGAGSVCVSAALLILITGHPVAAGFLALWGIFAVGLSDNVVKPYLMKDEVGLHGAVVFFSLLGGLAFLGGVGLIAGPLIVAFFLTLMRFWRLESGRDSPSTPGVSG